MLSAVAARKARLQAQTSAHAAPSPPQPRKSYSPSPEPEKSSGDTEPPSKRKPFAPAPKRSRKKRKVTKPAEKKQPSRYFAERDSFKEQEDVIEVDDEHDPSESSSTSGSGESSGELFSLPVGPTAAAQAKRRHTWSPGAPPAESSEDEAKDVTFEPVVRAAEEPPQLLSTFQPVPDRNFFHLSPDELSSLAISPSASGKLLVLQLTERLTLLGTYSIIVLQGVIRLNGIELTPSLFAHPVFAPQSSPLPVIECTSSKNSSRTTVFQLPSRFIASASRATAVVVLQELRTGVEGLGRVCRTFEGAFEPSRWQRKQTEVDLGLEGVYYVTYRNQDVQPFVMLSSWTCALEAALVEAEEGKTFVRKIFLVQGAKKTGKSTFARTLANKLLSRYKYVAFLECDLGQSEFTAGGMVALSILGNPVFGPPFTHPSIPHRAHYLGSTTPRNLPSQYLEAIGALMQTYNVDIQYSGLLETQGDGDSRIADIIPLVVNMMGWTKGLGADLSRKVLETVEPSIVFSFEAPLQDSAWPASRNVDYVDVLTPFEIGLDGIATRYSLEVIPSSAMSQRYSPADHRTLSLLSYFHAVFPIPSSGGSHLQSTYATEWNTTLPLCAQAPYELVANAALDAIILSGPGSEDIIPYEIHRVLNGAVVGLVSCEPGALDLDVSSQNNASMTRGIPYTQGAAPPPPAASTCHGLALVRSVSSSAPAKLHVLTPLPPAFLASAHPRVLLKGEMELPVWGMVDFRAEDAIAGVDHAKVPFLRWGKTEGTGAERRRVRRNLMRRGQQ
ncbi:uncharacterized protein PHACADRAFT_113119 [Phanerochaete carnosa HHB-10118-sp]|uniref:Polynucleotide 5'-hydroxyl-kinase GRC3 n=1 Tax=Phanerochaete carnosa (strain HHB-10118-sp) TaxID=650164 RepID=K5V881_PHACS|nr:uncharacterized protein PHACADRAFT_113119 [Phanerochaete carnosa HHB-10118-sp]EKM59001.1 hypothetical protein PHACADRAFT_113119 [Phanerochaete carnosa HHB-10118-sp]